MSTSLFRMAMIAFLSCGVSAALPGCDKDDAEEVGDSVKDAAEDTADAVDDGVKKAADKTEDAVDDVKDAVN